MNVSSQPLVTVVVITYNSGKYVLETLQSIKDQTYANTELIITDDCSNDATLLICEQWLASNRDRFVRAELLKTNKNTGIPANCNRGVKAAQGQWIKIIAGDDVLERKCIEANIKFLEEKGFPSIIVISNIIKFESKNGCNENGVRIVPKNLFMLTGNVDPAIQYKYLIYRYFGNTPSFFIAKEILVEVGFDERFPFIEDRPFVLNATKKGYAIYYLNADTVYYRVSDSSVFSSKSSEVLFNDFYIKIRPFTIEYIYPHISLLERTLLDIEFYRTKAIDRFKLNKNTFICRIINSLSYRLTPYRLYNKLQVMRQSNKDYWVKKRLR